MTPSFKKSLAEILDIDVTDIDDDFDLDDSVWDSLAIISTAVLVDEEYSKTVDGEKLKACKNIKDLMMLIQV